MLALSRNHSCQVFSAQNNSLLENLAFTDDVSSVLLIFIIVSDLFYIEMILPSVASCDFARTHPPFLASSRSLKNLKKENLQKVIYFICKVYYKNVSFLTPGDPRPLWTYNYFLSEIHLLNVSHSRRTNLDFYRICGCSASTLFHIIQLLQNSMRDIPHFRRTYVDIYRICA